MGVKNFWIELASGQKFNPLQPQETRYLLQDIIPALSKICRYNGQTRRYYSVAEHSVHIAEFLRREKYDRTIIRTGLMHDAAEAYVGDVVVCLKDLLPEFKRIEDTIMMCIAETFGLIFPFPAIVKEADRRILADERQAVMGPSDNVWPSDDFPPLGVFIKGWNPTNAAQEFMRIYNSTCLDEGYEPTS